MDKNDLKRIDYNIQAMPQARAQLIEDFRETLSEFIRFGTPAEMHYRKEELDVLLEMLGLLDGISSDQVAFVRIHGTIDGDEEFHDDVTYAGLRTVDNILNNLPDLRGLWSDNPNDFTASVGILLDEASLLVLSLRQEESPIICSQCPNSYYPCDHNDGKYDYDISYWAVLLHPDNLKGIDFDRG